MSIVCVGIDPGLHGGVAVVGSCGAILGLHPMPTHGRKAIDLTTIRGLLLRAKPEIVAIEAVSAFHRAASKSSFCFGQGFGQIEGLLVGIGLAYRMVKPVEWQRHAHAGIDRKIAAKDRSLIAAKRAYPAMDFRASSKSTKAHDGMVDALLIARWVAKEGGLRV